MTHKFLLLPKERSALLSFLEAHADCDAELEVRATPTGVGVKTELLCRGCGETQDITDYAAG